MICKLHAKTTKRHPVVASRRKQGLERARNGPSAPAGVRSFALFAESLKLFQTVAGAIAIADRQCVATRSADCGAGAVPVCVLRPQRTGPNKFALEEQRADMQLGIMLLILDPRKQNRLALENASELAGKTGPAVDVLVCGHLQGLSDTTNLDRAVLDI